ncbi:unnamed protein product [Amoebophrya sp. A25]|nr:unnamed protein product [Amoebophrya sp. A25]|eukprot:GSA25T00004803001.1
MAMLGAALSICEGFGLRMEMLQGDSAGALMALLWALGAPSSFAREIYTMLAGGGKKEMLKLRLSDYHEYAIDEIERRWPNAHELVRGRYQLGVTIGFRDHRWISDFPSFADLRRVLHASMHIPYLWRPYDFHSVEKRGAEGGGGDAGGGGNDPGIANTSVMTTTTSLPVPRLPILMHKDKPQIDQNTQTAEADSCNGCGVPWSMVEKMEKMSIKDKQGQGQHRRVVSTSTTSRPAFMVLATAPAGGTSPPADSSADDDQRDTDNESSSSSSATQAAQDRRRVPVDLEKNKNHGHTRLSAIDGCVAMDETHLAHGDETLVVSAMPWSDWPDSGWCDIHATLSPMETLFPPGDPAGVIALGNKLATLWLQRGGRLKAGKRRALVMKKGFFVVAGIGMWACRHIEEKALPEYQRRPPIVADVSPPKSKL